jgi:hypothetical protein
MVGCRMGIYEQPQYYDIAFGFIDPHKQVDTFEEIIATFSHRQASRMGRRIGRP